MGPRACSAGSDAPSQRCWRRRWHGRTCCHYSPAALATSHKGKGVQRRARRAGVRRAARDIGRGGGSKKPKKGGKKSVQIAEEDLLTVRTTAMSHDGLYVVGGCDDGSIVVWQLAT